MTHPMNDIMDLLASILQYSMKSKQTSQLDIKNKSHNKVRKQVAS